MRHPGRGLDPSTRPNSGRGPMSNLSPEPLSTSGRRALAATMLGTATRLGAVPLPAAIVPSRSTNAWFAFRSSAEKRGMPARMSESVNVTGRPPAGRSRTQLGRRSCSRARVPQPGHQPSDASVSTACSSSPACSDTASTRNPGSTRSGHEDHAGRGRALPAAARVRGLRAVPRRSARRPRACRGRGAGPARWRCGTPGWSGPGGSAAAPTRPARPARPSDRPARPRRRPPVGRW